jgi:hypothetical protein
MEIDGIIVPYAMGIDEIVIPLAALIIPIAILIWTLVDLSKPPSSAKAVAKIVLGVTSAVLLAPPAGGLFFTGLGAVIALLGTADLAATRTTLSKP